MATTLQVIESAIGQLALVVEQTPGTFSDAQAIEESSRAAELVTDFLVAADLLVRDGSPTGELLLRCLPFEGSQRGWLEDAYRENAPTDLTWLLVDQGFVTETMKSWARQLTHPDTRSPFRGLAASARELCRWLALPADDRNR